MPPSLDGGRTAKTPRSRMRKDRQLRYRELQGSRNIRPLCLLCKWDMTRESRVAFSFGFAATKCNSAHGGAVVRYGGVRVSAADDEADVEKTLSGDLNAFE